MVLGAWDDHVQPDCRTAVGHIGLGDARAGRRASVAGVVGVAAAVSGHVAPDAEQLGPDGDVVPAAGRGAGPEGQDLNAAEHCKGGREGGRDGGMDHQGSNNTMIGCGGDGLSITFKIVCWQARHNLHRLQGSEGQENIA